MGCCGVTYEEEIEKQVSDYIKTLNESEETKRKLLQEVHDDLKKKQQRIKMKKMLIKIWIKIINL